MKLDQITWLQYLLVTAGLTSAYYLAVVLTFYGARKGAALRLFRKAGDNDNPLPSAGAPAEADDEVMGPAAAEDPAAEDQELQFEEDEYAGDGIPLHPPGSPEVPSGATEQAQAVRAMTEEVLTLIRVIGTTGESKENFTMLIRLLTDKYHNLQHSGYQHQVSALLADARDAGQFSFPLTDDEINHFWNP